MVAVIARVLVRRPLSVVVVGAAIIVILGVLSMHVIGPTTRCATTTPPPSMRDHQRAAPDGVHVSETREDSYANQGAHGANQCTAAPSRKALMQLAGPGPVLAMTVVTALSGHVLARGRDRPHEPDRLSIVGVLRR